MTNPNQTAPLTIEQVAEYTARVVQEVEKAVVGKRAVLNQMMAAFLSSGGHILLEDYPGLAKTLIATSFASALGLEFNRIQFTPDLLPGDITGGYIFDSRSSPTSCWATRSTAPHPKPNRLCSRPCRNIR